VSRRATRSDPRCGGRDLDAALAGRERGRHVNEQDGCAKAADHRALLEGGLDLTSAPATSRVKNGARTTVGVGTPAARDLSERRPGPRRVGSGLFGGRHRPRAAARLFDDHSAQSQQEQAEHQCRYEDHQHDDGDAGFDLMSSRRSKHLGRRDTRRQPALRCLVATEQEVPGDADLSTASGDCTARLV
jgi:hypothetical protein